MALNISCGANFCPMCKTNDPPLTDRRSALNCPGCDTLFHKRCTRDLKKLDNGAFSVCCDKSADRSILAPPPTDDDFELDFDNLPDTIQISGPDLCKLINKITTKAVEQTIQSFSPSIDSVNKRIKNLESKSSQLERSYQVLADKIHEAESYLKNSFENDCELMYAEFSDRDSRKNNLILYNHPETSESKLNSQVSGILKKLASFDLSNVKTTRLGPKNSSVCRPIRIKLPNRENVFEVINNKKKWPKDLSFAPDRTKMQRLVLKKYSEIIKDHNEKNPTDTLSIKYHNNIPTVINSDNEIIYPNSSYAPILNKKQSNSTSTPISKNGPSGNHSKMD